jgi:Concanavalin A-like lectin/glucanases superfamily
MLIGGDVEFAFVGLLLHCDGADGSTTFTDVKGHTITAYHATKLLLHCDGADGSTTFTDVMGHTLTPSGNVQIDTAQSKFGGASALFDGSGDYLSIADSADWNFGSGNFTIEAWVRATTSTYIPIFGQFENTESNTNRMMSGYWGGNWNFYCETTSAQVEVTVADTPPTGTWFHIAIVRSGNSFYFFRDGTQIGTTQTSSGSVHDISGSAVVGLARTSNTLRFMDGWLDDIRVTKGVARYTANFTAPTAAFPDY